MSWLIKYILGFNVYFGFLAKFLIMMHLCCFRFCSQVCLVNFFHQEMKQNNSYCYVINEADFTNMANVNVFEVSSGIFLHACLDLWPCVCVKRRKTNIYLSLR